MLYSDKVLFSELIKENRWDAGYIYNFSLPIRKLKNDPEFVLKKLDDKDISSVISDGEHSQLPRQKELGIRYLYGRNLKDGIINFDPIADDSYVDEKTYKDNERIHLQDGDILVEIVGTIGKAALYRINSYVGIAGIPRHIARIHTTEKLLPGYLLGILLSKFGKTQMGISGTGNIQPLLSLTNLKKIVIPVPKNFGVQKTISEKFEIMVHLETKALAQINLAKDLFIQALGIDLKKIEKANFYKVHFRNLDDSWTPKFYYPLYQNTLKEIKRKFETIKLCDIPADISRGDEVGSENYRGYLEKINTDVPFVRTSDFVNYEIDSYPDFYISENIYNELNQDVRHGDILFTNDGKIGLCAIFTENDECIIQSHIRRIRIKEKLSPYYVFTFLTTDFALYQVYRYVVVQSTISTISNHLSEIEIPILPRDKQEEISQLTKDGFKLKNERKALVKQANNMVENIVRAKLRY
ncbi:MAG: restriction endonuclease subunit S [Candidatus Lokiarchaeia archaeon]